jgi:hypothetical protein
LAFIREALNMLLDVCNPLPDPFLIGVFFGEEPNNGGGGDGSLKVAYRPSSLVEAAAACPAYGCADQISPLYLDKLEAGER